MYEVLPAEVHTEQERVADDDEQRFGASDGHVEPERSFYASAVVQVWEIETIKKSFPPKNKDSFWPFIDGYRTK